MFKNKFWLTVFFIFQFFAVLMITTGMLKPDFAIALAVVQTLVVGIFAAIDLEQGIYAAILSIPFYLAIPNARFDSLSAWRFAFLALFLVFVWKKLKTKEKIKFLPWDKNLKYFGIMILISALFIAPANGAAFKQFLFGLNIYILYIVILNVINTKEQFARAFKVILSSLFTFVALGFVQLVISFKVNIYYFWQYWATYVARAYYGATFANTASYSNSWFAFNNHVPSLRMFSLLPDSHSFAVICMFTILFAATLNFFVQRKVKPWLWLIIVLSDLGLVFSGTRGMWVGVLAPLALMVYFYAKHYGRKLLKPMFYPIVIFALAIAISPLVVKGLNDLVKNSSADNFLQRAASIYDLGETSNAGRIAIWKYTLKDVVASHPLLGIGYGNFQNYVTPAQEKEYNLPKQYITAHSLYLNILAELGLIGFAVFVYYIKNIVQAFLGFFKKHYLYAEDGLVFFAVNSALYIAWLLAYSVFDSTIMNDRVLMYFFIVLALSGKIIQNYSKESKDTNA